MDKNLVPLKGAQFRSGPGAAYEELGSAGSEKLEIREFAKNGKWLRVKPVRGLFAYVNTSFLQIDKSKQPAEEFHPARNPNESPLGNSSSVSPVKNFRSPAGRRRHRHSRRGPLPVQATHILVVKGE